MEENNRNKNIQSKVQWLLILFIIVIVNVIGSYFYGSIDLTDDKRFTISQSTLNIISKPDDNVYVRVFLDGEFPAGFKRLQTSVSDMLIEFRRVNPGIIYEFEDPSSGTAKEIGQKRELLAKDNIFPIALSYSDGTQLVQKAVFPYAMITYQRRKFVVNLLESQMPGDDEDVILNKSVSLLEYKFANAFQKILAETPRNIFYTSGNGEWNEGETFRLEAEIRKYHSFSRVNLDTLLKLDNTVDLLLVAGPKNQFPLKNQFKIDQYIMGGGKVIWLIDKMDASMDSISKHKFYVAPEFETGLDEMLFKYGVRIRPDLVLDLESSSIPQVVNSGSDKLQTRMFPWIYHPLVSSKSEHPIVKNIDRVNMFFPSTIDTIKTESKVNKTILLQSSRYARVQLSPVRLSFEILKAEPDPAKFNQGNVPLAILLEGEFESFFKNRLTGEFQTVLEQLNTPFKEKSVPTKQIVVSDSEFMTNLIKYATGQTEDIGYNAWERRYYKGNKDFILNSIEYMLDEDNILESRSKEIKLRLLDAVRTKSEKSFWQFINIGIPVIFLIIFGFVFNFLRKRKYTIS
ncbi:MAG: gliding motility-associated ABC transporter substrate-binding protein GldG [Saprospiraceae bacterium]|nr:gliding motility-associated ABC transporter substrate-binding protein GldG [Saprospiraceae bacterium]